MRHHRALLAVLAGYCLLSLGYNVAVPLGEAPDEATHAEYVRYLLRHRELPVLKGLADTDNESGGGIAQGGHPPFFYVLALIAGVGELIPVVGPLLSAIPAIAVAASVSWNKALFVIIFFVLQQQFENHVLVPKVMERQVGVSPVTVIVALLIGGNLLGIVGAILAVPTAAIIQVLFNEMTSSQA